MTKMDIPTLVERLRTMHDHRGDGIPTQYVNPDGPEAAERIEALERALEQTPLRAKNESGEDFDTRQTAWLVEHYRPCMARAALKEPTI